MRKYLSHVWNIMRYKKLVFIAAALVISLCFMLVLAGINGYKETILDSDYQKGNTISAFLTDNALDGEKRELLNNLIKEKRIAYCDIFLNRENTVSYRLGGNFTAYGFSFSETKKQAILDKEWESEYKVGDMYVFLDEQYEILGFIKDLNFCYLSAPVYQTAETAYAVNICYKKVLSHDDYENEVEFLKEKLGENLTVNVETLKLTEYIMILGKSFNNVIMIVFAILSLCVILRLYFTNISKIYTCYKTVGYSKKSILRISAAEIFILSLLSYFVGVMWYFVYCAIRGMKYHYLSALDMFVASLPCIAVAMIIYIIITMFFASKINTFRRRKRYDKN